ncbi:hypothetical protein GCM10011321_26150 [Youhaiella tibetensis]|uniref:hypothetical protein n=1 Tax=Paradevosia tibetensis TaxID=1447062 RepID=UPI0019875CF9|nr:hypothetical protein [Youhaiella tibetensis]GGF33786.1 hypothetical protein GCM10011321_26150 [Youhaiella tibetensis]
MDSERVEITADLIAALLREQHPDLADLPLSLGAALLAVVRADIRPELAISMNGIS